MEKKILIAVDDSRQSQNAVQYAAAIYGVQEEVKFILMHVQPTISQYLLDEAQKSPRAYAELEKINRRNSEAGQRLLENSKAQMVALGMTAGDIQLTNRPRTLGVAKDILEYSAAGHLDAIIVGRRGLSGLEEVFLGSVSANIIENTVVTPVWLVDGKGSGKDILLAVDGSESSYRAVDHLAFIMGGNTDVKIVFFHVTPRLKDFCPVDFEEDTTAELENIIRQGDKDCIDHFLSHAKKRLDEAGIRENQISFKVRDGIMRVGKAVLDEYRAGDFGTLVVGRRGVNKKFFTGSVSRYLVNKFADGALWIVP
jgi:nucleotide-binding universal stress UspA family protein